MLVSRDPDLFWLAVTPNARVADAWSMLASQPFPPACGAILSRSTYSGRQLREPSTESNCAVVTVGRVVVLTPPNVIAFTWAEDDWVAATDVSGQLVDTASAPSRAANCILNTEAGSPHPPTASTRSCKRTQTADVRSSKIWRHC